jgi:hypothetical protein
MHINRPRPHTQTTDIAFEGSRAQELVKDMDSAAQASGQTWWVFFDNPPEGLAPDPQVQFEHLVKSLVTSSNLRVVLTGYETYRLSPLRFVTLGAVDTAPRSGLLIDELGPFTRADVEATLNSMITLLDPEKNLGPVDLRRMTDKALVGLDNDNRGEFAGDHIATVVSRVREQAKDFLDIEE